MRAGRRRPRRSGATRGGSRRGRRHGSGGCRVGGRRATGSASSRPDDDEVLGRVEDLSVELGGEVVWIEDALVDLPARTVIQDALLPLVAGLARSRDAP